MRYQRISADCHIDLPWIPPDLFTANASGGAQGPHAVRQGRPRRPVLDRQERDELRARGAASDRPGPKYEAGKHHRVDVMAATGLYDDGRRASASAHDPCARGEGHGARRRGRPKSSRHPGRGHAGSTITRPPPRCSTSTTTGSWSSAATIPTASSASPACPTATSTPRCRRSTRWPSSACGAWSSRARGTWSRCGTRRGSRSGRRSTT